MTAQVEWHLAGTFDCDRCGRENFFRCLMVRPADQKDAHVVRPPAKVKCVHCEAEFEPVADTSDEQQ